MSFITTSTDKLEINQYLKLDDFLLISQIHILSKNCNDKTLRILCDNFTNNRIFKNEKITNQDKLIGIENYLLKLEPWISLKRKKNGF